MNETTHRGGPRIGLILLIPAIAIVARASMRHHRATWASPDGHEAVHMPPRLESMLTAWHDRAHGTTTPQTEHAAG